MTPRALLAFTLFRAKVNPGTVWKFWKQGKIQTNIQTGVCENFDYEKYYIKPNHVTRPDAIQNADLYTTDGIAKEMVVTEPTRYRDGAIYFDPLNPLEIMERLSDLYFNEELKQTLVFRGRRQIEKYSWEKTGKETRSLLFE